MAQLRHFTPVCTDPSHMASSINQPTVFHARIHRERGNLDPGPSRSTKEKALSRAPMKRFAPASFEVVMHGLGSQPWSSSADEAPILNLPFQVSSPSNSHSVCFAILMRGLFARHVLGDAVTCTVHRAKR